jgi:predicted  nucleic acid-binding Zn-ribbon protein
MYVQKLASALEFKEAEHRGLLQSQELLETREKAAQGELEIARQALATVKAEMQQLSSAAADEKLRLEKEVSSLQQASADIQEEHSKTQQALRQREEEMLQLRSMMKGLAAFPDVLEFHRMLHILVTACHWS